MLYLRLIFFILAAYVSVIPLACCYASHESSAQVWQVGEQRWTTEEESRYGKWIETNITEDFFIRYKIPIDCADVPYAIRWIYARIAHLPAAATTGHNRLIGHWSTAWGHLPTHPVWYKDRRFRAALMAMLAATSTHTLPNDVYPIRVDAESVTPGTVFLVSESHSGIVGDIIMDGSTTHPIQTFEAGMPSRLQQLRRRNFITPDPDPLNISGLIKFRWPVEDSKRWHYLPVNEYPFYSREQYSLAFIKGYADYLEAVAKRIDPTVYDPAEKITKVINTLIRRLNERIPIVLEGNRQCPADRCPENSLLWDIYSTPCRDEFISVIIDHLEEIIKKNHLDRDAILEKMAGIHLQITPERSVSLQYVFQNARWMASDPEATIECRWGLDKCSIIADHMRQAQESISFINRHYSRSDPLFAARSLRIQQAIMDEMTREGRLNQCTPPQVLVD